MCSLAGVRLDSLGGLMSPLNEGQHLVLAFCSYEHWLKESNPAVRRVVAQMKRSTI